MFSNMGHLATTISTPEERLEWRTRHIRENDKFMRHLPKIELHVHIEGTMTPNLRWKLSQRNGIPLTAGSDKVPLTSLEEVIQAYKQIRGRIGAGSAEGRKCFTFFEIYYGGFDLLQTEEDFYDLAMGYFERAAEMNVRYAEPFFDPQGHTRRGIPFEVFMKGFKRAQEEAEKRLKVDSQWIMCILRDSPVQDAMPTYKAMLPWGSMVVGIGLDSDELDRPPSLFYDVFQRARADGFKITSHCDFNQKNTHEHIRQCAEELSGKGADRIDHGMNAADKPELMKLIKEKDIGLTLSPCGYIRHSSEADVFSRIRKLFDVGIKIAIASDDPAYMEDNWILHNTYLVKEKCGFSNAELLQLQRNGVAICWWDEVSRASFSTELLNFEATFS